MMKNCNKCHKENREQARFCRFCGEKLISHKEKEESGSTRVNRSGSRKKLDRLDDLIGLEAQKQEVRELVKSIRTIVKHRGHGALKNFNANILITGPSGSGKTALMMAVAEFLMKENVFGENDGQAYTATSLENIDLDEKPAKAVFIDDAQRNFSNDADALLVGTPLEYVFEKARLHFALQDEQFILVVAGDTKLQQLVDSEPDLSGLFALQLRLPEHTPVEVAEICEAILREKHKMGLSEDAFDKLSRIFNYQRRHCEKFGNAHLANAKANELVRFATRRGRGSMPSEIIAVDVQGKEYVPKTLDEVMGEFDKYVGVDGIKKTMANIVDSIAAFQRLHPDKTYELKDHYLFVGNPGTGKTTMARVFADALNAMGILPSGQLVEVAPKDLRGQYVGHTGPLVDAAFDKAMGGILFIDEAYNMWNGADDQFGNEAVTVLLKNMEDRKGKLVVILAGYPREMDNFVRNANPGLKDRFTETIDFRDYKGTELAEIARRMIKAHGYTLDAKAKCMIEKYYEKMYTSRGKDFANARSVRNAVDRAIKTQNSRVRKADGLAPSQEFVLTMEDITGNEKQPKTVDEVIASMSDLIGMTEIKEEIRKLANVAMVNRMRMERGLGSATLQPINIILTGNPGTGKTTIAKRLGEVLHAAGVLPTDKVIEREAKTILSSYVNASGQNMDKAVDEAMGGVLFIDEAYNLLPQQGSMNNTGNEALDALMTRMENDKGKFVVVIAGYKDRMQELIRRGNPGLMSRFNKNFHIEDYDSDALLKIFKLNVEKRKFILTDEAEQKVSGYIDVMVDNKGLHFGNAREIVNLLNEVVELQGNRIASDTSIVNINPDALSTIEAVDIPQHRL